MSNTTLESQVAELMAAAKPKTEQERVQEQILEGLRKLGGQTVGDDSLVFEGSRFVLPKNMEGKISAAVRYLKDWDEQQNTRFEFSREFNYRPFDGAAAFERAMKKQFGTTGIGRGHASFFGSTPPRYRSISIGASGESLQVPWGTVEFSPLEAEFELDYTHSSEYGVVFQLAVTAPRRYRQHVEGFFKLVEKELREHSIYKGKAITADPMEPLFLDTTLTDPSKVIYTQDVMTQLEVNFWSPLRYTQTFRDNGIPLKRAVLLEGPNGTGKTLAGSLTSQVATQNGWTYILVRVGDDALEALKTAKAYAPAVVWIEDIDTLADTSKDRERISKVLDTLDNVQAKGTEVMAGFTSNFAEKLDKSVVRPGRLDAVIHVAELDAAGYERLVKALIPGNLLADVDFAAVADAYKEFLPSFATEATQRAVRYNVSRNGGVPTKINTQDLLDAAKGMKEHLQLMNDAVNADHEKDSIGVQLAGLVRDVLLQDVKGDLKSTGRSTELTFVPSSKN